MRPSPMNRRQPNRMCRLVCIWILASGTASAAVPPSAPEPVPASISESGRIEVSQGEPASLTFWNREIAILRADIGGISPADRVRRIQGKIADVLENNPGEKAEAIRSTFANLAGFWVQIDGHPVFGLIPEDADGMTGETVEEQVRRAVDLLQEALDARREQRSLPLILEGLGLATAATLLLLVLLWGVVKLEGRAMRRLLRTGSRSAEPVSTSRAPIKVAGLDLEPILIGIERTAIKATGFGLAAILIYLWLTFLFGRFPFTRPWGEGLAEFMLDLLATFADGALQALPGFFTVLVIFVLTRIIVRAVDGFFRTVERGAMAVSWLEADTAKATRRLTVTLIWVFAVTVAYPYIPGSDSQAFKGISVLVGLMVSLGSAGLINQVMSGLVIAYSRALKVGELVAVGNTLGTVSEVGMLSTKVITPKRETVTVPNAVLVSSPITNYSRLADERGAVVGTRVTIGYDTPWRQVHAMLTLAAERASLVRKEPAPFVLQRTLADFYPEYELIVHIDRPEQRFFALSELHGHIQDVFNEYGVQIMSPNFEAQPGQKVWVPKEDWFAAPAAPEARTELREL
ncbi:mechanosensitive ion channel family protein [Thiocapsa sp.]|uniref:mechanosensitive ion channel family protein n=1 Tax=Thiocapsa sp. TaxID=2024551 RepID=UPI002BD518A0|nr:mechanosensitive ion channel domain-containing protein [Thiocapsa sp.]HSO81520.1 mechanosensitive ion channel domain-containing protein [Thiocapsa sp.]